jgi:hypothetical protein
MGSKSALLRTLAAASRAKTAGFGVPNSEKFGAPLRIKLRTHTLWSQADADEAPRRPPDRSIYSGLRFRLPRRNDVDQLRAVPRSGSRHAPRRREDERLPQDQDRQLPPEAAAARYAPAAPGRSKTLRISRQCRAFSPSTISASKASSTYKGVGMISPCRRNAPGSNVCRCPSSVFMARPIC